jgi:uncharacterized protein YndB with AHSA1/START domain
MLRTISVTTHVAASPEAVFDVVTDIQRLPEWNRGITDIVEAPERLEEGAVWKVRIHAMRQSWVSRSTATALDMGTLHFAYRSQSDDGNPSYADWAWRIEPEDDGARAIVTVNLVPITFWRRYLFARIRRPGLHKEMGESLAALTALLQP